jgi:hypothetical protein
LGVCWMLHIRHSIFSAKPIGERAITEAFMIN